MQEVFQELQQAIPDAAQVVRVVTRLTMATLCGGVIGIQRQLVKKAAGLRTHMLVALGCSLLVVCCYDFGMTPSDLSRVIQGVAAGTGFIGAGAILKLSHEKEITGVTTAASIWVTAAAGVAAGLGRWGSAVVAVVMAWIILAILGSLEHRAEARRTAAEPAQEGHSDAS